MVRLSGQFPGQLAEYRFREQKFVVDASLYLDKSERCVQIAVQYNESCEACSSVNPVVPGQMLQGPLPLR